MAACVFQVRLRENKWVYFIGEAEKTEREIFFMLALDCDILLL